MPRPRVKTVVIPEHLAVRIAAGTLAAQREQLEELIKLKPLLTAG